MFSNLPLLAFLLLVIILAAVYYYRFELSRRFYQRPADKQTAKTEERTSEDHECPKCGRQMQKGYLVSASGMRWRDSATFRQFEGFSDLWRDVERRSEPFPPLYPQQPFGLKAYRCRICGIVLIDENQLPFQ